MTVLELQRETVQNLRRTVQYRLLWVDREKLFNAHAWRLLAKLGGLGAIW
jgi:hypothetical protein